MIRKLILCLLVAGCVSTPGQDRITLLLAGHKVVYDPNPLVENDVPDTQTWAADGTTVFDAGPGAFGGASKGRWKSERGLYCATYSTQVEAKWTCWRLTTSEGGKRIRFKKTPRELFEFRKTDYLGTFVD